MSGTEDPGGLSPDEQAFFDSRGETAPEPETEQPAAEPEAEAQAEAEGQEPAAEGEEGKEDVPVEKRPIPYAALKEERERRRDLEKQLAEQREQWARADERLRALTEAQQPQQEEQPSGIEELAAFSPEAAREVEGIKRWQAEQQQAAQQQQQYQQLVGAYQAKAQEFAAQTPDFADAYNHVREAHARRLQIQGVPPQQIAAVVERDELALAAMALHQGANPAERLYALAKEYGYQPKTAAPEQQPDAAAIIDQKADTVARAKSLSSAGGQSSPNRVDAKALASMSDDEFEAFMSKGGANGFRKALNA